MRGVDLEQWLAKQKLAERNPKWYEGVEQWVANLPNKKIISPVPSLSQSLDRVVLPDPAYMGDVFMLGVRTANEIKRLTNTPMTSKKSWITVLIIVMMLGVMGVYVWDGVEKGTISFGGLDIPGLDRATGTASSGPCSISALQSKYTNSMDLAVAIELGDVSCPTLPSPLDTMVAAQDLSLIHISEPTRPY